MSSAASTEQRFELDLQAGTKAVDNGGGYDLIRQPKADTPTAVTYSKSVVMKFSCMGLYSGAKNYKC